MRLARIGLGVLGLAAMAYAVVGILTDEGVHLPGVAGFMAAVLIGHDLIVLPLAVAVGALVVRVVPPWARRWAQGALFGSGVVTVLAIPLLVGVGRTATNPSRLPLDYRLGWVLVIAAIWAVALTGSLVSRAWARRAQARAGQDR